MRYANGLIGFLVVLALILGILYLVGIRFGLQ